MSQPTSTNRRKTLVGVIIACAAIGLVLVLVLWPNKVRESRAVEGDPPTEVHLTGVIRDFRESHVDFNVAPPAGLGHYAGVVSLPLAATGRPQFSGSGYKVIDEWLDSTGRPIAPHLYQPGGGAADSDGVTVDKTIFVSQYCQVIPASGSQVVMRSNATGAGTVTVTNTNALVDGDVHVGPGADPALAIVTTNGGTITGARTVLMETVTMPIILLPDSMPISQGDRVIDVPTVLSGDLHFDTLEINNNPTVTISGPTTILCEQSFDVQGGSTTVELEPGASLALYVRGLPEEDGSPGRLRFDNGLNFNLNTGDPNLATVYYLGTTDVEVANTAEVCARVISPAARLRIYNNSHLHGTFLGDALHMENSGLFTVHGGVTVPSCITVADAAGAQGTSDNGGIASADSFDQWYRDVLGTNTSKHHVITLTRDAAGVYEYLDDAFHPIDDRLYGNEGEIHNNYFTYVITAQGAYQACTGQFIEFEGGDGVWMFVNGDLVIDLGGVGAATEQYLELDRLGLADGSMYDFRLFYAQRRSSASVFRLRTNVMLDTEEAPPMVTAPYD